ncbi:GntR family transcriptional regulator [Nocardiopsis metallicus]|uniref:GntR family transcriptional regulator n=1 Tax=Nocardiopsis metallicus TaxID=179819 RepID=UPI001619BACA|nr:GntR family transcriptional regulator [Nocardiopsis metallicus]
MPTSLPAGYGPDSQVIDGPTPLPAQLAAILAARIDRGDFSGGKLPSVAALQKGYEVSRGTAQRAITILAEHGRVQVSAGKGVYPVDP